MRSFLGSNHIWEVVIFGNGQYLGSGPCWGQTIYRIRSFLGLESVWDLVILGSVYISMICLFLGTAVSGIRNYFWDQAMSGNRPLPGSYSICCFRSFLGLVIRLYIYTVWVIVVILLCWRSGHFQDQTVCISALSKMRSLLASGYIFMIWVHLGSDRCWDQSFSVRMDKSMIRLFLGSGSIAVMKVFGSSCDQVIPYRSRTMDFLWAQTISEIRDIQEKRSLYHVYRLHTIFCRYTVQIHAPFYLRVDVFVVGQGWRTGTYTLFAWFFLFGQ